MGEPFVGEIRMFANSYPPRGWAFCDGQLLDINQNSILFSVITTIYGGDGRTNFAVPDLRGRVPMHWGTGPGLSRYVVGQWDGYTEIPLSEIQIPSHNHEAIAYRGTSESTSPAGSYLGNYSDVKEYKKSPFTEVNMSNRAISVEGESRGHENKQPYLTFNFYIALEGMYPPRS